MTPRPRRKKGARPFRIASLTRAILGILAEQFCARTDELYDLIPNGTGNPLHHQRSIRRSLQLLRDAVDPAEKKDPTHMKWGYIRSVPWSDPKVGNRLEHPMYAHGLTDRGVRLARQLRLDPNGQAKSFQEISVGRVDHELRVRSFVKQLRTQLAGHGLDLIVEQANIKGSSVAPDLLLYTYDPKADTRSAPIFLEFEKQKRGKYEDGAPQVIRKLTAFANLYNSELCQTEFGFQKFYVLIVLQTDRKVDFLLQDLKDRGLARQTYMIMSEQQLAGDILAPILRTPTSDCRHSILHL